MEYKSRNEFFFVVYDDIIKAPVINILKDITVKYREYYKGFIDMTAFKSMNTHEEFIDFIINRPDKNVIKSLRSREFDYDKAWEDIYARNPLLIHNSLLLPFGSSILILLKQSFVKSIYIWSEKYDKRIHFDIQENFGLDTVGYVTGDLKDVLNNLPAITCYVLDDVMKVNTLIDLGKIELSTVCVADYGYNYTSSEEGIRRELKIPSLFNLEKTHKFRSTMFKAIQN